MITTRAALLSLSATLIGCSGDPTGSTPPDPIDPTPRAAVRVVSGADVPDTIRARLAQPLVLEVTDSLKQLVADVEVQFSAPIEPAAPHCIGSACGRTHAVFAQGPKRTDEQGRVSTPIEFGRIAGEGRLAVAVPALGILDTVRFTIKPGRAAHVVITTRDTVAYQGTAVTLGAVVTDRYGNVLPELPSLEGSVATPTSGLRVTGAAFGVHPVVARAGSLTDTARLTVIPRGTIAALEQYSHDGKNAVVVVDLDGTKRARIPVDRQISGLAWTADGSRIVYAKRDSFAETNRLFTTTLSGKATPLMSKSTASDEQWPTLTRDGRWVYFAERHLETWAWQIWRVRPDGTGAQRVGAHFSSGSGAHGAMLAPSPDGGRVAFSWAGDWTLTGSLRLLDAATGSFVDIPVETTGGAAWSPTGDRIAYARLFGAGVVNANGTDDRDYDLGGSIAVENSLDWSPDGRWVLAQTGGPIHLIHIESGEMIPLPHLGAAYMARWKP